MLTLHILIFFFTMFQVNGKISKTIDVQDRSVQCEQHMNCLQKLTNGIRVSKSVRYGCLRYANKAAQLGQTNAQFALGNMYRTGAGIAKDSKQTVKWFKEAGKKGHAKAQFNLGAMYINGDVVNKSLKDAKYWIALANKNGHERAQEIWDAFELQKY